MNIFSKIFSNKVDSAIPIIYSFIVLCLILAGFILYGGTSEVPSLMLGTVFVPTTALFWFLSLKYHTPEKLKLWNEMESAKKNKQIFIKNISRETIGGSSSAFRYTYEALVVTEKFIYTFVSLRGNLSVKKINKLTSQIEEDKDLKSYGEHLNDFFISEEARDLFEKGDLHLREDGFIKEITNVLNKKDSEMNNYQEKTPTSKKENLSSKV